MWVLHLQPATDDAGELPEDVERAMQRQMEYIAHRDHNERLRSQAQLAIYRANGLGLATGTIIGGSVYAFMTYHGTFTTAPRSTKIMSASLLIGGGAILGLELFGGATEFYQDIKYRMQRDYFDGKATSSRDDTE